MKNKKLYLTTIATAIVTTAVASPIGATSIEDITNHYNVEAVPEVESPEVTYSNIANTVTGKELGDLQKLIDSINSPNATTQDKITNFTSLDSKLSTLSNQEVTYTSGLVSNDDTLRVNALEKIFGVSLTDIPVWNNDGRVSENGVPFTTVESLKKDYNYAINASREALILYGIKNNNWQPLTWFEALERPSHYELVSGKLVKNKNYYAYMADNLLTSLRSKATNSNLPTEHIELNKKVYEQELQSVINGYNSAPGYAVYSPFLHHIYSPVNSLTVIPYEKDFVSSVWNKPEVRRGESIGGNNPYATIIKALNDGTMKGNLLDGSNSLTATNSTTSNIELVETPVKEQVTVATTSDNKYHELIASIESSVKEGEVSVNTITVEPMEEVQEESIFKKFVVKLKSIANLD